MKRLPIMLVTFAMIIGLATSAIAWTSHSGRCTKLKLDTSAKAVKTSIEKLLAIVETGTMEIREISEDGVGVCLFNTQHFDPLTLRGEHIIEIVIHTLRACPSANTVVLGINGRPMFIFTYSDAQEELCYKEVEE